MKAKLSGMKREYKTYSAITRMQHERPTKIGFMEYITYTNRQQIIKQYGLTVDNPSNGSLEIKEIRRSNHYLVYEVNKPKVSERNEIMDATLIELRGLTNEQLGLYMRKSYNHTSSLSKLAEIEMIRYITAKDLLESRAIPFPTLKSMMKEFNNIPTSDRNIYHAKLVDNEIKKEKKRAIERKQIKDNVTDILMRLMINNGFELKRS